MEQHRRGEAALSLELQITPLNFWTEAAWERSACGSDRIPGSQQDRQGKDKGLINLIGDPDAGPGADWDCAG